LHTPIHSTRKTGGGSTNEIKIKTKPFFHDHFLIFYFHFRTSHTSVYAKDDGRRFYERGEEQGEAVYAGETQLCGAVEIAHEKEPEGDVCKGTHQDAEEHGEEDEEEDDAQSQGISQGTRRHPARASLIMISIVSHWLIRMHGEVEEEEYDAQAQVTRRCRGRRVPSD
jgi:hypothetical protein